MSGRRVPPGAHAAWLAAMLIAASAPAAAFELPELMLLLARRPAGEATFVEQRDVQGLDQPLRSSGTLSYVAPDRFTRRTLEPRPETMAVEGNRLTLTRSGRSRSLSLDAQTETAAVIDAMRGTLTGDAAALQRWFRTELAGNAGDWTLQLTPLAGRSLGGVQAMHIAGRGDEVRRVEVLLADGDRSVMIITPLPAAAAASMAAPASRP